MFSNAAWKFVFALTVSIWLLSANCVLSQDVKAIKAEGMGMAPAIKDGDLIKIDRKYFESAEVERFDIIAFSLSEEQKTLVGRTEDLYHIKRIVGMPNERIEIRAGKTYINGEHLSEPFLEELWVEDNFGPILIPEGECLLLGDNRPNSFDSRYFNPATVQASDLVGKVIEIVRAKK